MEYQLAVKAELQGTPRILEKITNFHAGCIGVLDHRWTWVSILDVTCRSFIPLYQAPVSETFSFALFFTLLSI